MLGSNLSNFGFFVLCEAKIRFALGPSKATRIVFNVTAAGGRP